MSKVCQITGKKIMMGNKVSHANNKSKKTFSPNLQEKKFFIPEENRWVVLKVSTSGMRNIDKKGITACLKEALAKGYIK